MSKFLELLGELQGIADEQNTMAKSLPAEDGKDDKTIQAAAAEGDNDPELDPDQDPDEDGDLDEDPDAPLTKSIKALDADGNEVDAVDATDLIKSMEARLESQDGALTQVAEIVKTQHTLIKSLHAKLERVSGQGRGRKTVLSIVEKPDAGTALAKSQAAAVPQITAGELMAKALDAQKAGRLTGLDVARAEASLNSGVSVPADILSRLQ